MGFTSLFNSLAYIPLISSLHFLTFFWHFSPCITHQVRDLLRGDPDTDVQIVFDREESTFFIKKQLAGGVKGIQNFPRWKINLPSLRTHYNNAHALLHALSHATSFYLILIPTWTSYQDFHLIFSLIYPFLSISPHNSGTITLAASPTASPDSPTSVRQEITIKRQLVRMSGERHTQDIRLVYFIACVTSSSWAEAVTSRFKIQIFFLTRL